MRGLEAADQKAVEKGRKGLRVETSKGAGGTEVVERGGHRGSARDLKGHPGWVFGGVPGSGEASGGGRPGQWGGRGRLRGVISSFFKGCGGLLVVWRYVQVLLYRLIPLSFFSFLCFLISLFTRFAAGRLTGEQESGVPRFDSQ